MIRQYRIMLSRRSTRELRDNMIRYCLGIGAGKNKHHFKQPYFKQTVFFKNII